MVVAACSGLGEDAAVAMIEEPAESYRALLGVGRSLFPGVRVGRPGRARSYWLTTTVLRVLRVWWKVDIDGADRVAPGAAILIGNHVSGLDPLVVVMSTRWRVTAFTKLEWFQGRGSLFFRLMGQIPLRRGAAEATDWAIEVASWALRHGTKVGIYPEGTRSPDPTKLHRLHGRVLVPLLRANPQVPVHAVTTAYQQRRWRRTLVRVRVSPRLALDTGSMTSEAMIAAIRDVLLGLGGQTYCDESAHAAKTKRTGGSTS